MAEIHWMIFGSSVWGESNGNVWKRKIRLKDSFLNSVEGRRFRGFYRREYLPIWGNSGHHQEKNGIYIYQEKNNTWSKIHTSNSIYDCSLTLKQKRKKGSTKSPDKIQLHKVSPKKARKRAAMWWKLSLTKTNKKAIGEEKELLKQFSEKPSEFSNAVPTPSHNWVRKWARRSLNSR